jgi:hypothetical protein
MAVTYRVEDLIPHDLENKLVMPTSKLVAQVKEQLQDGYQDTLNSLTDVGNVMAGTTKQLFVNPVETITNWSEQVSAGSHEWVAQTQNTFLPLYQHWQVQFGTGKAKTAEALQAFWDHPQQAMLETLAPVTQIAGKVYVILERDFQFLLDNPSQYFVATFTPAATFVSSAADSTKITLITSYSNLMDIWPS